MSETEKLSEFEKLRLKYEELILEKIKTFISTNDEYGEWREMSIDHLKPHISYRTLCVMVKNYVDEGYVDCDKLDEIIAPVMIDDYRIYDNVFVDHINRIDESRNDGFNNVWEIIWFLGHVDHTKFPRLKDGLINHILTDKSQPKHNLIREPYVKIKKFDIEKLKKQFRGFIPDELFSEIFGEPIVKLTRTPISEEDCDLPFD